MKITKKLVNVVENITSRISSKSGLELALELETAKRQLKEAKLQKDLYELEVMMLKKRLRDIDRGITGV